MQTLILLEKIELLYSNWGYLLVFFSSLIETSPFGFAIPGGVIVATAGFFAYNNSVSLVRIIISGTLGMLLTFLAAYFLGNKTGFLIAKKLRQEKFANRAKILLDKHGAIILTTSLLANLLRFWVSYVAGTKKFNIIRFSFYALIASLTWNSLLVTIGYLAGSKRSSLETGLARFGLLSWGFLAITISILYIKTKQEIKELK